MLPESQCGFRRHRGTTDTARAGPAPGKPMWLPPTPRNNRYDLPATREVPGDANSPLHYLRGSKRSPKAGTAPGKPMWLPPTPRNNRYDLCRPLPESQCGFRRHRGTTDMIFAARRCGFRRHRGTTDMIFAARQLQEKSQEM
ncbi:unnamed protein product [Schistocephalus solidus]|uniref:Uncharacterized protein n=1 Tax=Schistocephalus solidus TaxID=70667 RepID=A0A3P7C2K6_SCHSO|nr:unnamed protein product [Schistocephalus solidus]